MYEYRIVEQGSYIVWITCLLSSYQDKIIAELVKKGYTISACGDKEVGNICWTTTNAPSALIVFSISSNASKATATSIHTDINDILSNNKMLFFSLIVCARGGACWNVGNINLTNKTPPPIKKKELTKNNVIPFKPSTDPS